MGARGRFLAQGCACALAHPGTAQASHRRPRSSTAAIPLQFGSFFPSSLLSLVFLRCRMAGVPLAARVWARHASTASTAAPASSAKRLALHISDPVTLLNNIAMRYQSASRSVRSERASLHGPPVLRPISSALALPLFVRRSPSPCCSLATKNKIKQVNRNCGFTGRGRSLWAHVPRLRTDPRDAS
jgi:hypothetical protein